MYVPCFNLILKLGLDEISLYLSSRKVFGDMICESMQIYNTSKHLLLHLCHTCTNLIFVVHHMCLSLTSKWQTRQEYMEDH